MPKLNTLKDLFIHQLQDLHNAENQLLKALPLMSKAASDESLKAAFDEHFEQTKVHVDRLDEIFQELGKSSKGKKCKAMEGLIAEGKETIEEDADPAVKDAALIAAAQRIEHYEIAGYGTVRTFAELLDLNDVADTLQITLDEESTTDERLTDIAQELNILADDGTEKEEAEETER